MSNIAKALKEEISRISRTYRIVKSHRSSPANDRLL
jgi:hypothetical protein